MGKFCQFKLFCYLSQMKSTLECQNFQVVLDIDQS